MSDRRRISDRVWEEAGTAEASICAAPLQQTRHVSNGEQGGNMHAHADHEHVHGDGAKRACETDQREDGIGKQKIAVVCELKV